MLKDFIKWIRTISDAALSKSLNRMIKIRSQIPDTIIDRFRIEDADCKIALMEKEWRCRAERAKSK